jgi:hypothetical protein
MTSCVAGFSTANVAPLLAGRQTPSMNKSV